MKLLLDEHVIPAVAQQLRQRGHDVVTVRDMRLEHAPDPDLMAGASRSRRAVVTVNHQDFRPLHAAYLTSGRQHYGLILIPRPAWLAGRGLGRLINALDTLLRTYPADDAMDTAEIWLPAD